MKNYIDIVGKVLDTGIRKSNRTGVDTIAIAGAMFEHDMAEGFPLVTTKHVPFRLVATELEFFIKGLTNKQWLIDRRNYIWNAWCNPEVIPYGHTDEIQEKMEHCRDLGPIYGWQWRHFGAAYKGPDVDYTDCGVDQLKNLIETIKKDPDNRRMIVTAWDPSILDQMALPPCHYSFQVTVIGGKLNLLWNQRSVDLALGLPFDIASYGLLLHLLAKETGLQEGKLVGFLADTHIYVNHIRGLYEQVVRVPYTLPKIITKDKDFSIFDWEYTDTEVLGYKHHPKIKYEVAI